MKQLSKGQTYTFLFGAFMMVIGAGVNMVADFALSDEIVADYFQKVGACMFMLGSVCFAAMQIMQKYTGKSITIERLRSIQIIGDICFVLAGLLLMENAFRIVEPMFTSSMDSLITYYRYINNNWVVALLVAAILEVYTTHRIAFELKKEDQ